MIFHSSESLREKESDSIMMGSVMCTLPRLPPPGSVCHLRDRARTEGWSRAHARDSTASINVRARTAEIQCDSRAACICMIMYIYLHKSHVRRDTLQITLLFCTGDTLTAKLAAERVSLRQVCKVAFCRRRAKGASVAPIVADHGCHWVNRRDAI